MHPHHGNQQDRIEERGGELFAEGERDSLKSKKTSENIVELPASLTSRAASWCRSRGIPSEPRQKQWR